MAKFKVGDRVVSHCDNYGITKTGWTGVVIGFNKWNSDRMFVRGENITGDCMEFDVSINDFDLANDQRKIVITTDGKTTTAILYDGKRVIRKETARCNPEDKFDFLTGAEIAFDRLTDREKTEKRDLRELMTPGTFGKSKKYGGFVMVGRALCFDGGDWMPVNDYSMDTLESKYGDRIEYLVRPTVPSFTVASIEYSNDKNVVWKRK